MYISVEYFFNTKKPFQASSKKFFLEFMQFTISSKIFIFIREYYSFIYLLFISNYSLKSDNSQFPSYFQEKIKKLPNY